MKGKKLLVISLAAFPLIVTACNNPGGGGGDGPNPQKDAVERDDYRSVYENVGSKVTIDMVTEDSNGLAYATVDGVNYELGMDFLSMAMVYNTSVPTGSAKYHTETDVYNEWWKLYIQRWNYLMPEVPLYSNVYYDVYNPKLDGIETSPYWGIADAINKASSTDGHVILGSTTELSGLFRNASWGVSSPTAANNDIQSLTTGFSTVMTTFNGAYEYNLYDEDTGLGALKAEPEITLNQDGTKTYTIEIAEGLKFSDGSPITAKNYIVGLLANSTEVGKAAGGSGSSGQVFVGYKKFREDASKQEPFKGIKLFSDYKFSVTLEADYANYYYSIAYAAYSPDPLKLYLGSATDAIRTNDNNEVYLAPSFFNKDANEKFTVAAEIEANMKDINKANMPYSGPFYVDSYDTAAKTATLKRNNYYPGDIFRGTAAETNPITEIAYIKLEDETQNSKFEAGEVDFLAGVTGGTATDNALALVQAGKAKETHYDRAGYGKLGFRCDFGPTMFKEVRRAIAYSINRPEFASQFTGGYGGVVDGPYYEGFDAYQAVKDTIKINKYSTSVAKAKEELIKGGWVYNADGSAYDENVGGVRYKKLEGYEKTFDNLTFSSLNSYWKTTYVKGEYYMPLVINWFGTVPNDVTDLLNLNWAGLKTANADIGMFVNYNGGCDFTLLIGELCYVPTYGWDGVKKLCAANFATSFGTAMYDFAFNWTLDQTIYDDASSCYLMDDADFFSNYVNE